LPLAGVSSIEADSDAQWESLKGQAARSHERAEAGHLGVDAANTELDLAKSRLRMLQGR
jgi:hypothetical protein